MSNEEYEIIIRDDGVFILETEEYRFHLDEKTHVEKIGRLINENEQLKQDGGYWAETAEARRKEIDTLQLENELLKETLKKEYMSLSGVLCDACKHQEETYTNNWFVGEDFDVKCNKGHEVLIDDDKQECSDFELKIGDVE